MELVLGLVLLALLQGLLVQQATQFGTPATIGVLMVSIAQIAAIWLLRRSCPPLAVKALLHIPAPRPLIGWIAVCVAGGLLVNYIDSLLPLDGTALDIFRPLTMHWTGWAAVAIVTPVVEEVTFRAITIEFLSRKLPAFAAVVGSAALFGVVHGDLRTGTFAIILGLIFGVAYVRTKSIVPSVVGHVATNAVGLAMLSQVGGT